MAQLSRGNFRAAKLGWWCHCGGCLLVHISQDRGTCSAKCELQYKPWAWGDNTLTSFVANVPLCVGLALRWGGGCRGGSLRLPQYCCEPKTALKTTVYFF